MARNSEIPAENFEEILTWLDPDRNVAAKIFLQLRQDLENIFKWRGCDDLEGLTDEVIDRVARKVHQVRPTYVGDPRLYFLAVANNLVKETQKKTRKQVGLEDIDLVDPKIAEGEEEESADMEECLQSCLQNLNANNRELILAYYAKEKQAKIDYRSELARRFGISVETLRVRVYRIRLSLQGCIESCLERKGHDNETD